MPADRSLRIFYSGIQIPLNAQAGRVLTSDGTGNGTWQAASASGAATYVSTAKWGVD